MKDSGSIRVPATLGIIAGNGVYPATMLRAARRAGVARVVVAAFAQETDATLEPEADAWEWLRVGQLGKLSRFLQAQGAKDAVMCGQIAPANLFALKPDLRVLLMLAKLRERNAETIFGGIAAELARDGITLLPATTFLEESLPAPGHICGPARKPRELADAEFGMRIAKETSRLDIGQTVIVRRGTVLAVEAFEGTNECIRRGGAMGRGLATMAKVSKPGQDFRFDVPVIGPATIAIAAESGVRTIAIEAHRTLILDSAEVARLCALHRVTLLAVEV